MCRCFFPFHRPLPLPPQHPQTSATGVLTFRPRPLPSILPRGVAPSAPSCPCDVPSQAANSIFEPDPPRDRSQGLPSGPNRFPTSHLLHNFTHDWSTPSPTRRSLLLLVSVHVREFVCVYVCFFYITMVFFTTLFGFCVLMCLSIAVCECRGKTPFSSYSF